MFLKLLCISVFIICISAQVEEYEGDFKPFGKQRYVLGSFENENPEEYYLPQTLIPTKYNLTVEPHFDDNTFTGRVLINGFNAMDLDEIVLHTLNLDIQMLEVYASGRHVDSNLDFDTEHEFLIVKLAETVGGLSNISLDISYTGVLDTNKKNRGFYIATYIDENGVEKRLATTHLEPTNAREVFPCFDEPALKATFDLQIIRPTHYNSKTNTLLQETITINDQLEMDVYKRTPLMSTYLICIVVSEFATIESSYPGQAMHQLHGEIADLKSNFGDLALLSSREVITALEEYTGVKFNLEKIGQVAIPRGYFGGAMENWGLVIYDEDSLLFKRNIDSEIRRQGVVNIISHEYSHQWFGNLVGPASWAYTWLNEGFATFFTMRVPNLIYPEWRSDEQFAWKIQYAMTQDAQETTRPMTMPVGKPENIMSTFDVVAYDKSACVLRMFENVLGANNYRVALNDYLTKRQFKAATADDLTASFQLVSKAANLNFPRDIKDIFDTWHLQKGFPIIRVTRDYEANTMTLKQERFVLPKTPNTNTSQVWHVPINYFVEKTPSEEREDTKPSFWLTDAELTVELPEEARDSFIVLNKQFTGYYRVNYDTENWLRIIQKGTNLLDMSKNSVQLLDDAFVLAFEGEIDMNIPANLMAVLILNNDNYLVLKSVIQYFDRFIEIFHDNDGFKLWTRDIFEKAYETYSHVEFDGDYIQTVVRNDLIPRLCRLGAHYCLDDMHEAMFKDFVSSSPNLQETVLCAGLMNPKDSMEKFNFVLRLINGTDVGDIRGRLMKALSCTKAIDTSATLLNWIVYPETNYLGWDVQTLMSYYCTDYDNAKYALNHYLTNFQQLEQSYDVESMRRFLNTIAVQIYNQEEADHIEEYMLAATYPEEYREVFMNAINTIKANIDKINNFPPAIKNWKKSV